MKVALIVNQKYKMFGSHTDSVNKICDLLLAEFEKSSDLEVEIFKRQTSKNKNRFLRKLLNITYWLKHQCYLPNADVLHYVSESEVTLAGVVSRLPKIVTLHGAEYFSHPTLRAKSRFSFRERFSRLLIRLFKNRVTFFTSVSSWASSVWVSGFSLNPQRMVVIANPISNYVFDNNFNRKEVDSSLLFVGNTKPQKNLDRIIRAVDELTKAHPRIELKIIGPSHDYPERQYITNLGAVEEERLYAEMHQATVLLFPSIVESFGMPAAEALALGTPVICSNSSALPEVTMGDAFYVDPYNWLDIADAIKQVIKEPQTRLPNPKMVKYRPLTVVSEYKEIYRRAYACCNNCNF